MGRANPALLIPYLKARLDAWPVPLRYRVALSGGADSTALLHALQRLRLQTPLDAIHLDHGLQAESAHWAGHCRELCADLGIPLKVIPLGLEPKPGESLEAHAREARRQTLMQFMVEGDLLLMAHHREDQAETLLLALLRGAGPAGLAAMPDRSPFGPGHLGRPLLDLGRADLRAYLRAHGVPWVEDPSNTDLRFDRNYLRHRILPGLRERWPGLDRTLSRSARLCAEAEDLVQAQAAGLLEKCAGRHGLAIPCLLSLEPPLLHALLRHWIRHLSLPRPGRTRLERIRREVLKAAPDRTPLVAWTGAEARRFRDELLILPPLPPRPADLDWPAGQGHLDLPQGLGRLSLSPPPARALRVRFGVTGVRCRLPRRPHRRRLKQLLQEAGVPAWLRPYLPMLFQDDRPLALGAVGPCVSDLQWDLQWRDHPWPGLIPSPRNGV